MGWFNFSRKKRAAARGFESKQTIEPNPLQAFILEPILTPSGLVDAPDHSPSVMDLVNHPVTDVHSTGDDLSYLPNYSHADTTMEHPAADDSTHDASTSEQPLALSGSGYSSAQEVPTDYAMTGSGYGDSGTTPTETPVTPPSNSGDDHSTLPAVNQSIPLTPTGPVEQTVADHATANSVPVDAVGSDAPPPDASSQSTVEIVDIDLTTDHVHSTSNYNTLGTAHEGVDNHSLLVIAQPR